MADGRVEFEITADGRKAYASIDQVTDALSKAGKNWESDAKKSTDAIGNSFTGMLKTVVSAVSAAKIGQMLLNIGKDAIQAASDLEEVQNVVDVTFGDDAAKIESWAKNAGKQFGLTETQAKRFTSTLGAMMKSAGMSGSQIADISTDLSGLAADMASFYNLDFDTAFQKIRSGISGETEPLKQLGINMSVANLNAFALQQGLTKTFDKMTQGEQVMLRYQYLMQATADAQGDFARTSDGYANATRMLETNIESLKTKLGQVLLPVINDVIAGINSMMEALTGNKKETVLDRFAAIDLKKEEKIANIEATAEKARTLTSVLEEIGGKIEDNKTAAGNMLDKVPDGKSGKLNDLKENIGNLQTAADHAKELIGKMADNAPGKNSMDNAKYAVDNVKEAAVMAKSAVEEITTGEANTGEGSSVEKITKSVRKIGEEAGTAKQAVEEIPSGKITKSSKPLPGVIKESVEEITTEAGNAKTAIEKIVSLAPSGKELDPLKTEVVNVGLEALTAAANIGALLTPSEEVTEADALWLETCKELVKTIPGLSDIINTQTGEIKGGTEAIYEYINAWEEGQKGLAMRSAHQQKAAALDSFAAELPGLELNKMVAERRVRKARDQINGLIEKYGLEGYTADTLSNFEPGSAWAEEKGLDYDSAKELSGEIKYYQTLKGNAIEATNAYEEQKQAYDEAVAAYEEEGNAIEETYGSAIEALNDWSDEQKEAGSAAVTAFQEAAKAVADYYGEVRKATKAQVDSNVSGFTKMKTAAEQAREAANAYKTLEEQLKKAGKTGTELQMKLDEANKQITAQSMREALDSQLAFINEYQQNLEDVRNSGLIDDKILAQLSDGSNESAQYLHAMAEAARAGDTKSLEQINEAWQKVNEGKEQFTDTLTQQKLAVDETYDAMVKKAEEAAKALDVSGTASESTGKNIEAMAQAIKDHVPDVAAQVDAILSELNKLNNWGVSIDLGSFGTFGFKLDGSHATGLNYVPFDGYLAQLHEGEGILTAEENRIWQAFKNGQRGVDYDQLGGIMRDSIKPGGDVYLDGRVVGAVVSQMQGNQYRTMQRSGWQS